MAKQVEKPWLATRIEFGLLLTFTRATCPLYSPLSLNISREVFSYIGLESIYLGTIRKAQLIVYDLTTESVHITVPSIGIDLFGAGVAMLNSNTMLTVGGSSEMQVRSIQIWTGEIAVEISMTRGRAWPGVLVYKDFVWVFGGNFVHTLDSVERFHRTNRAWEKGPTMLSPKVSFTPCEHQGLIYLPEASRQKKQLEVLNPLTAVYSLLPLELHSSCVGSVSFIVDSSLFFIDFSKKAGYWTLGSQGKQLTDLQIYTNEASYCCSIGTSIRYRETIYWLDEDFALVKFDWKTYTLYRISLE